MLSKVATRNFLGRNRASKLLPSQHKAFSTLAVQEDKPTNLGGSDNFRTLWEMSALRTSEAAVKATEEASYLADLKN